MVEGRKEETGKSEEQMAGRSEGSDENDSPRTGGRRGGPESRGKSDTIAAQGVKVISVTWLKAFPLFHSHAEGLTQLLPQIQEAEPSMNRSVFQNSVM